MTTTIRIFDTECEVIAEQSRRDDDDNERSGVALVYEPPGNLILLTDEGEPGQPAWEDMVGVVMDNWMVTVAFVTHQHEYLRLTQEEAEAFIQKIKEANPRPSVTPQWRPSYTTC